LSETDLDFELVCSATETAEILADEKFDLLILGQLGCVNEKISVEKLLEKLAIYKIALLLISSNFSAESKKVGFENCDYLEKPFSSDELLDKIFDLLGAD
jgi:DNA-binding response OmpR family regulator